MLLVSGCCAKESAPKPEPARAPAVAVEAPAPPPPKPAPKPETLTAAIAAFKSEMADSRNKPDDGAVALTRAWAEKGYAWADLAAIPETRHALVAKDSDAEKGKRLCTGGTIVEIAKVSPGIFHGRMMNDAVEVSTFYAVASTGTLVQKNAARFCGIVTGRHSYGNAGGGTTHSTMLVGMFDLPENKAKK